MIKVSLVMYNHEHPPDPVQAFVLRPFYQQHPYAAVKNSWGEPAITTVRQRGLAGGTPAGEAPYLAIVPYLLRIMFAEAFPVGLWPAQPPAKLLLMCHQHTESDSVFQQSVEGSGRISFPCQPNRWRGSA